MDHPCHRFVTGVVRKWTGEAMCLRGICRQGERSLQTRESIDGRSEMPQKYLQGRWPLPSKKWL